jgi:glycosyltransferase involved in cell wall biosynthesis
VYTDAEVVGGAERSAATLLAELGPHVEATVLAVDPAVAQVLADARPGTATELVRSAPNKGDVRGVAAHLRTVRRLRPDVLHVNLRWPWSGQYAIAAGLAARHVSVVVVEHAAPVDTTSRLQRRLKGAASRRLGAHVAVSERAARELERILRLPAGSVRTIPNGVVEYTASPVPVPTPGPLVGSVGRLVPEKGFDLLVRALPDLPGASLLLVGDGPARGSLERLAAELGVADRLHVTGWRDDSRGYLHAMDVFVLPSHLENLPLVVIEAMLAARPVVATDIGSLREVVTEGHTGLLVPPDDPAALAAAIRGLLADSEARERLGQRGREQALERFTAAAMARRFEALYDEVT